MSDDQPHSGSRWEPTDNRPLAADAGADAGSPAGTAGSAAATASPTAAEATPFWRRRPRNLRLRNMRPKVAAGIAAVALVSSAGGFVVGSAVGGDSMTPAGFSDGDGDGDGDRGSGHRDRDGDFGRGAPDGDFAPPPMPGGPGAAPGDSTAPGAEDVEPPITGQGSDDGSDDGSTTAPTTAPTTPPRPPPESPAVTMSIDLHAGSRRPGPSNHPVSGLDHGRHARLDARVRGATYAVTGLGLVALVVPWATAGGASDLLAWGTGLTSLGRLAGLAGSFLLLVQVVLMARIPALENAFGRDRLTRIHRVVGFSSFTLVLAHVLLITWGYAAGAITALPRMLWDLIVTYPGMLLAAAGTVAVAMVSVTSVRAARRRLRYESWHLLHLYAYLGAGLALPHQLWTGQQFQDSPVLTAGWWTAWGLAAGATLWWRLVVPIARTLRHDLRVTSVVSETPGVVSVYLTGRHLDQLRIRAGQFAVWRFLGRRGWTRGNPYSVSAAPDGRSLRLTVRDLGDGSASLATLRPGSRVAFEGPYGRLSHRARSRPRVAFIGAGVGMTPLRALAEELAYDDGDAVLLHRHHGDPLFAAEIDVLARERGLEHIELVGRRRSDRSWLPEGADGWTDTAALRHLVPDLADRDVFVCGPDPWMDAVAAAAGEVGVPDRQLHLERFTW